MREIQEEVSPSLGYTSSTIGTYLKRMLERGLVNAEENDYAWRYSAKYSEEKIQQRLVSSLLKKAFGGSPSKLLMQAFASKKPTAEELAAIERLYKKHKKT